MSYLKFEFKKAFLNRWFAGSLLVMTLLAILCAIGAYSFFNEMYAYLLAQSDVADPDFPTMSMFTYLLFTRSDQPATEAFYILLPLIAVLPYSWSLCKEKNSAYLDNVYSRIAKWRYIFAKTIATFSCSFVAMAIPLTINLIVTACLIPAFENDISAFIYSGLDLSRLWSSFFYNQPIVYCLLFILFTSSFSGFWACAVQIIGAFVSRPEKLIASSFVILYCFQAFEEKIQTCIWGNNIETLSLSPLEFIRGVSANGSVTNEMSFIPWIVLLLGIWLIFLHLNKNRDEL